MNIEELVKKYLDKWRKHTFLSPEPQIRAALTEQAATHAMELRAYEATVQNLEQRIRELEAQRVPEGWKPVPIEATQEMLKASGLYDDDTIEVNSAAAMAGQIYRAMLAAAPAPAPVILASRCPMCFYQHGHQIGCENNPVDIALLAAAPAPKEGE